MQLTNQPLHFNLEKPFKTAKRTVSIKFRQELVTLKWNQFEGHGLIIFDNDNTESQSIIDKNMSMCSSILLDTDPYSIRKVLDLLDEKIPHFPNYIAGIDMAMHDLLGKITNLPLYKLLGLEGYTLPNTLYSIPNTDFKTIMKKVESVIDWPIIKFKMNKLDMEVIKQTRSIYNGMLWIDGNGTWSEELLQNSIDFLEKYKVSVIEQPLPQGEFARMGGIKKNDDLMLIVDEDTEDFAKITKMADYIDGVNIKLPRIGGITRALDSAICAKNLGLKVIFGCEVGSTLHTTATAHLAGLADFIDVDGHIYLLEDAFKGIDVNKGKVTLPSGPGFGCTPISF